jgi:hypothetical protein
LAVVKKAVVVVSAFVAARRVPSAPKRVFANEGKRFGGNRPEIGTIAFP